MSATRHRLLLAASTALLLAVAVAWAAWPEGAARADLQPVRPLATAPTSGAPTVDTRPPAVLRPSLLHPERLRIASIGVDARIVAVGVAADGQMEIPPAADVGWYRLGPAPGQRGSAVVAGHLDREGERGAFFALGSVPVGAQVVVDGDGTSRRFVVTAREQVAKDAVDLRRYFTRSGPERLTLITCGGAFSRSERHYADNIVITAQLVA